MALSLSREKEILAKIDKLRQEIHALHSKPSKNAWGDEQNVQAKQREMTSLERELRQDELSLAELAVEVDEFLGMSQPHKPAPVAHAGLSADDWKRVRRRHLTKKIMKPFKRIIRGYEENSINESWSSGGKPQDKSCWECSASIKDTELKEFQWISSKHYHEFVTLCEECYGVYEGNIEGVR